MRDLSDDATADNEWRVTARLRDPGKRLQAMSVVQQELPSVRVSSDGDSTLFLYAANREDAEIALYTLLGLVDRDGFASAVVTERWHPVAEDWELADRPLPQTAEEWKSEFARRQPTRWLSGPGLGHRTS